MADPQQNPIPPEDQPIIPDNPIVDPNVGRLPNPGDPQPDQSTLGDNPPNVEARLSALEGRVANLESHTQAPGAAGTTGA